MLPSSFAGTSPDFRLLFEALPGLYIAVLPDAPRFTIGAVSEGFLHTIGRQREEILGRSVFDIFGDHPSGAQSTSVTNFRASLEFVLRERSPYLQSVQRYHLRCSPLQGSARQEREWEVQHTPVYGEEGEVTAILLRAEEKTPPALQREQEEATTILESITDAFFALNQDWRFTYVNRQAGTLLGCLADDLLGRIIWDVFPGLEGSEFQRAYYRAAQEGITSSLTAFYPDHDRWYEVHVYPARTGITIYFRDVSEHKRMEAALRASEEKYHSLFLRIDVGFCIIEVLFDDTGRAVDYLFLEVNPAFEQQTGLQDTVGTRVREFAPTHEEYWFEIYGKVALTGEAVRFSNEAKALNRWFDVYAFRFGGEGSHKVAVLFTDITERMLRDAEIATLNAQLRRSMTETHHRVKNNLQVIAALAEMQAEDSDIVPASTLERVAKHTRSLAAIHDLLTHQSKESVNGAESVRSGELLDRLVPLLQITAGRRRINARCDDFPLTTRQATATSILINELVSNALKHTNAGIDIAFTLIEQRPDSQERRHFPRAQLDICDRGPGFPDDFDPDRAAHTGMELVQMLTRHDLQGELRFANGAEGGACVTIIFSLNPER